MKEKINKTPGHPIIITVITLLIGGTIGTWSLMSILSSLNKVDWDTRKLSEQYLIATNQSIPDISGTSIFADTFFINYLLPIFFLLLFSTFFLYLINKGNEAPR